MIYYIKKNILIHFLLSIALLVNTVFICPYLPAVSVYNISTLAPESSFIPTLQEIMALKDPYRELKKHGGMSKIQEYALIAMAQNGNKKAMTTLIRQHTRSVYREVRRKGYFTDEGKGEDLVQEGLMGIEHAVKKFDFTFDVRLSTYAPYWIRTYIQNFLNRKAFLVRRGNDDVLIIQRTGRAVARYKAVYGEEPSYEELIKFDSSIEEACSEEEFDEQYSSGYNPEFFSLDAYLSEEDGDAPWIDFLEDDKQENPELNLKNEELLEMYAKGIEFLKGQGVSARDLNCFYSRAGMFVSDDGSVHKCRICTLEDLGAEHDVSGEAIRQAVEKVEKRLERYFRREHGINHSFLIDEDEEEDRFLRAKTGTVKTEEHKGENIMTKLMETLSGLEGEKRLARAIEILGFNSPEAFSAEFSGQVDYREGMYSVLHAAVVYCGKYTPFICDLLGVSEQWFREQCKIVGLDIDTVKHGEGGRLLRALEALPEGESSVERLDKAVCVMGYPGIWTFRDTYFNDKQVNTVLLPYELECILEEVKRGLEEGKTGVFREAIRNVGCFNMDEFRDRYEKSYEDRNIYFRWIVGLIGEVSSHDKTGLLESLGVGDDFVVYALGHCKVPCDLIADGEARQLSFLLDSYGGRSVEEAERAVKKMGYKDLEIFEKLFVLSKPIQEILADCYVRSRIIGKRINRKADVGVDDKRGADLIPEIKIQESLIDILGLKIKEFQERNVDGAVWLALNLLGFDNISTFEQVCGNVQLYNVFSRELVSEAFAHNSGDIIAMCEALGVPRAWLEEKLEEYAITRENIEFREDIRLAKFLEKRKSHRYNPYDIDAVVKDMGYADLEAFRICINNDERVQNVWRQYFVDLLEDNGGNLVYCATLVDLNRDEFEDWIEELGILIKHLDYSRVLNQESDTGRVAKVITDREFRESFSMNPRKKIEQIVTEGNWHSIAEQVRVIQEGEVSSRDSLIDVLSLWYDRKGIANCLSIAIETVDKQFKKSREDLAFPSYIVLDGVFFFHPINTVQEYISNKNVLNDGEAGKRQLRTRISALKRVERDKLLKGIQSVFGLQEPPEEEDMWKYCSQCKSLSELGNILGFKSRKTFNRVINSLLKDDECFEWKSLSEYCLTVGEKSKKQVILISPVGGREVKGYFREKVFKPLCLEYENRFGYPIKVDSFHDLDDWVMVSDLQKMFPFLSKDYFRDTSMVQKFKVPYQNGVLIPPIEVERLRQELIAQVHSQFQVLKKHGIFSKDTTQSDLSFNDAVTALGEIKSEDNWMKGQQLAAETGVSMDIILRLTSERVLPCFKFDIFVTKTQFYYPRSALKYFRRRDNVLIARMRKFCELNAVENIPKNGEISEWRDLISSAFVNAQRVRDELGINITDWANSEEILRVEFFGENASKVYCTNEYFEYLKRQLEIEQRKRLIAVKKQAEQYEEFEEMMGEQSPDEVFSFFSTEWYTFSQLGRLLGLSPNAIKKRIKVRDLPVVDVNFIGFPHTFFIPPSVALQLGLDRAFLVGGEKTLDDSDRACLVSV